MMKMITGDKIMENDAKQSLIDDITEGFASENDRSANGRLYVSSSGFCPRKAALDATMPDRYGFNGVSNAFMRLGNCMEKILLEGAFASKRLLFADYSIPTTGLDVGGKIDGILEFNHKVYLAEIKSIAYLPKGDETEILTNPRFGQNLAQTSIYSAITGLPAILVYFSRFVKQSGKSNNLALKVFDLGFDVERLTPYIESLATSSFAIDAGVLPDIPDNFDMKEHCGFCPFKSNCWDSGSFVLEDNPAVLATVETKAKNFADEFMSTAAIEKRRNGVLKHISLNGTPHAEKLLHKKDWKILT